MRPASSVTAYYAESSAVLAWLLGEDVRDAVGETLKAAETIVTSDLTVVEVERQLIRAWSMHLLSEAKRSDGTAAFARVLSRWVRVSVTPAVIDRTLRPFPVEPVRSIDAVHLATALAAREALPGLRILTLDQRIRENGERLGFEVLP